MSWGDILEARVQTRVVREKRFLGKDVFVLKYRVLDHEGDLLMEKPIFLAHSLFCVLLYATGVAQKGIKFMQKLESEAYGFKMSFTARDERLEKLLKNTIDVSSGSILGIMPEVEQ